MFVLVAGHREVGARVGLRLDEAPQEGEAVLLEVVEARRDEATDAQLVLVLVTRIEVEPCSKQRYKINITTVLLFSAFLVMQFCHPVC